MAGGSLEDVDRWARATMTTSGDGTVLSNGTVVDRSCYDGLTPAAAALRLSRLEAATLFAGDQANGCFESFRVPDPTNVAGTLARTRISCSDLPEPRDGESYWGVNRGWCPTHRLFGSLSTTAHYDRTYGITLDNGTNSLMDSGDVTGLSSMIFHELLHHYSNQRSWHDSVSEPGNTRSATSCTNSTYEDRIYFMQALCFPSAGHGRDFWNDGFSTAPASCPGLCEAALGDPPDAATVREAEPFYGGNAVLAAPLTLGDRTNICARVRSTRERIENLRLHRTHVDHFLNRALNGIPLSLRIGPFGDLLREARRYYPQAGSLRARTRAAALTLFSQYRERVDAEIAAICAPGSTVGGLGPTSRYSFCTDHPVRIRGAFDHVRSYMLEGEDIDYRTFRTEPDVL